MVTTIRTQPTKAVHKSTFVIQPEHERILRAVYDFRFMTAEQLLRLFQQKHLPTMQIKLQQLTNEKYLNRFAQARYSSFGKLPYVYELATPGVRLLGELGLDAPVYFQRKKTTKRLPTDIDHHLAINEFLMAAKFLEQFEPRVSLFESRHDWRLKHEPIKLTLYRDIESKKLTCHTKLVPDGFIDFRITASDGTKKPARIFLEMDLDTQERHDFKRKIAQYCEFFHAGIYHDLYGGAPYVAVCYVTIAGDRRREEMKLWTEEQLQRPLYSPASSVSGASDADLFLFASVPKGELSPLNVFCSPLWYAPFEDTPQAVLRLPKQTLIFE